MLTLDTEQIERHKAIMRRDEHRAKTDAYVEAQLRDAVFVQDRDTSIANVDRQMGKPMWDTELALRLARITKNVRIEPHAVNPTKNVVYDMRGGEKKQLILCERGLMPEWSVMGRSQKPKYDGLYRKDVAIPWREEKRGWRTVLAALVTSDLLTVPQAQKFCHKYGTEDRRSWANLVGQRSGNEVF